MYAMATRYVIKQDKLADAHVLSKRLLPAAAVIPGLREMLNLQQDSGAGLFIMLYDSKADAERAAPGVQLVWDQFAELYETAPVGEAFNLRGRVALPREDEQSG